MRDKLLKLRDELEEIAATGDEFAAVVELDQSKVGRLSRMDALQAQATFVYLDSAGQELESFPHTLTGTYGFDGQEPLAASGAKVVQETVAFFMPEGTATKP